MSNVIPISDVNAAKSLMWDAQKMGERLEEMSPERHITILKILNAQWDLRVSTIQKQAQEDAAAARKAAEEANAAIEREAKFSPHTIPLQPGTPIASA